MTIRLDAGHRLDCHQTFGQVLDTGTVPDRTWVAIIIDSRTGRFVAQSDLRTTRDEALADAEVAYSRR